MRMNNFNYIIKRTAIMFALFIVIGAISCGPNFAENLQPGNQYKIIQPIYLMADYKSPKNRQLSRETARAYLHAKQYANRYFTAFQCKVPEGTIITIIGPAPKVWSLPFLADRYFVQLDPDLSRGLNVILELNRGIEGSLDGLNPGLFSRME